jgi:hypothetical protein
MSREVLPTVGGVWHRYGRPGRRRAGVGRVGDARLGVTARAVVEDHRGLTVELTEERWAHIVERHPEIGGLEKSVLRAVESPDHRIRGRVANEEWYYVRTDAPSNWLKVVVAYAEGRGHIVTAYARRSTP